MKNYANLVLCTIACIVLIACGSDNPTPPSTKFSIKGTISAKTTEDVSGVVVSTGSKSATSSSAGTYSIDDLDAGAYTLTPSKTGFTFTPPTAEVTIGTSSVENINFVIAGVEDIPTHPLMIAIEPGTFMQGTNPNQSNPGARPRHKVTLTRRYWIAETETTQEQFEKVMGFNPSASKNPKAPVESTTYYQAIEFCNKLSEMEGLDKAYTVTDLMVVWNREANGYRLPSESEWEYAARAGDTNNTYNGISSGNDPEPVIDAVAWYLYNTTTEPHDQFAAVPRAVRLKLPNAWGLYDVLGNVNEAVNDKHIDYTTDDKVDPYIVFDVTGTVARGGACSSVSKFTTLVTRHNISPLEPYYNVGFRVARNR